MTTSNPRLSDLEYADDEVLEQDSTTLPIQQLDAGLKYSLDDNEEENLPLPFISYDDVQNPKINNNSFFSKHYHNDKHLKSHNTPIYKLLGAITAVILGSLCIASVLVFPMHLIIGAVITIIAGLYASFQIYQHAKAYLQKEDGQKPASNEV